MTTDVKFSQTAVAAPTQDKDTKFRLFVKLTKPRLSGLVVFSGIFGYLMAVKGPTDWFTLLALSVGSYLITGAANTINQIIEIEPDKLMRRTRVRPLPTGLLETGHAKVFAWVLAIAGTLMLGFWVGIMAAALSVLSLVLYAFVYTPLKKISPVAVLVGALPGAMPPLIGWVAGSGGTLGTGAWILFGIQFFWQFPHFWAIAWVGDEDYRRAGFKMLPAAKGFPVAFQIAVYTMFLIPVGVLPALFGLTGPVSAYIAVAAGLVFLAQAFPLLKDGTDKNALRIMFASFFYLPLIQLALLFDKI